jgi:hypothetical protein
MILLFNADHFSKSETRFQIPKCTFVGFGRRWHCPIDLLKAVAAIKCGLHHIMFYNYGSIYSQAAAQAQSSASDAQQSAREAKTETELLRHDVDRLLLITEALWTILKKAHGHSDDELVNLVKEIDMRDGRLDGRAPKAPPQTCPSCSRMNSGKQTRCLYCGQPLPVTLFGS